MAGIILTSSINEQDDFEFDKHFINETIIRMLKSEIIDDPKILLFIKMINSYTNRINNSNIKKLKKPHVLSGWNPALRYKTLNYAMSILPLPHRSSTLNWCINLLATLSGFDIKEEGFKGFDFLTEQMNSN